MRKAKEKVNRNTFHDMQCHRNDDGITFALPEIGVTPPNARTHGIVKT